MKRKIAAWKGLIKKGVYPRCILCGEPITNVKDLTTEHLLPKSKGGSSEDYNIYPSHAACNWRKGNMTLREWVEYLKKENERCR